MCVLGIDEHGTSIALYPDRMGEYTPVLCASYRLFEKNVLRTTAASYVYHD